MKKNVKRGDIYYADLSPVVGCEQGGIRPVIIIQNDTGNKHCPTVIVAAITSQIKNLCQLILIFLQKIVIFLQIPRFYWNR
jgi:mRNA-degrading endonuclease toxin of MazEF toxin-antitoxin module